MVKAPRLRHPTFQRIFGRAEEARGAGPSLRHRLARSPRSNWSPESAEVRPLFKAPREDGSWFRAELDCSKCSSTIHLKEKSKNMTTPHLKKSIGRSSSRLALLLIPLVFACFAFSHSMRAVSPPPDGDYTGANTAEGGAGALMSLTTGTTTRRLVGCAL